MDKDSAQEGHLYGFFLAMKDWKVWWFAIALTGITIGLSFNAFFREYRETYLSYSADVLTPQQVRFPVPDTWNPRE